MERFNVVRYTAEGRFDSVISGCGKHRGTWDSDHSRSSAYRHMKVLRAAQPEFKFRVEPTV